MGRCRLPNRGKLFRSDDGNFRKAEAGSAISDGIARLQLPNFVSVEARQQAFSKATVAARLVVPVPRELLARQLAEAKRITSPLRAA
jgi:hypothetical protein